MPVIGHRPVQGFRESSLAEIERRPEIDKLLKSIDCDPRILSFHMLIRLMQVCHAAGDVFAPDRDPVEIGHFLVRHVLSGEAAREFNGKRMSDWYGHLNPFIGVELDLSRFTSRSRLTEIGGWSNSRKTFVTRPATLVVCPDAAVAARIRGLLPAVTVPLNDTTLELTAPLTTPQRRKLEAAGIFKHSDG